MTPLGATQFAFFQGFENLSYFMGLAFIVVSIWLYSKVPSWVIATSALVALGAGSVEFVISTLDNSLGALVGMLLVGGIVSWIGIRASSSKEA